MNGEHTPVLNMPGDPHDIEGMRRALTIDFYGVPKRPMYATVRNLMAEVIRLREALDRVAASFGCVDGCSGPESCLRCFVESLGDKQ